MKSEKFATAVLFLILMLFLTAACGSDDNAQRLEEQKKSQQRADSLALKIAVTPTADCEPLFYAERQGWFERDSLSVRLVVFQAQMDQDTAVERHRVEGLTTDRERMAWLNSHGTPLVEVATTPLAWQLIANKDARLRQIEQLDDKMVAMTRHSATDRLAAWMIDSVGLTPEHVFRIQINDVDIRLQMLLNNIMDAAFLPEPQATVAREAGHNVLLSTDSLGMSYGVLAFRQDVVDDSLRRRQIEKLVTIYSAAQDSVLNRQR